MAQPVHFSATVENAKRHDENVCTYTLISDKRLPRFIPGQFIHLAIDPYDPATFWPVSRVFSVANSVSDRRTIRLTISRQGHFTSRILNEIQSGSTVWGKGPYGEFSLLRPASDHIAVLIAGGTGITPFAAYMDDALQRGVLPATEAIVHYGARTSDLLIYTELVEKCAATFPTFSRRYYVERENVHESSPVHYSSNTDIGQLNIDTIVERTPQSLNAVYYISGPRAMIESFKARLQTRHLVSSSSIMVDAWD